MNFLEVNFNRKNYLSRIQWIFINISYFDLSNDVSLELL